VDEVRLCGDVIGEPCAFEVECQLPAGHEGDHYAEVRWPRYEPQPPGPPTAMSQLLAKTFTPLIEHQLKTGLVFGASSMLPAAD